MNMGKSLVSRWIRYGKVTNQAQTSGVRRPRGPAH
ncbi:hypothetical protein FKM82_019961 [Ascaphus truei]